jgi:hypothetical protein
MDYDELIVKLEEFLKTALTISPEWKALEWSNLGPGNLFDEFKRVGALLDWLTNSQLFFELHLGRIQEELNNKEVQLEKALNEEIKRSSRLLISSGYAVEERMGLTRLAAGQLYDDVLNLRAKVTKAKNLIDIVKRKAKMLSDFKQDSKTASQLMQFGNQIGELK